MQDIAIPEEIIQDIAVSEAHNFTEIANRSPLSGARFLTYAHKNIFTQLERFCGEEKLRRCKILEIGCGNGFFLCYALKAGLDMVGIEPEDSTDFQGRYTRAARLLRLNGIGDPEKFLLPASAEKLPFEDASFDVVLGVAVLEHVQRLDLTMKEAIRVLKGQGMLWMNMPNYNSIFEGHYNIFWIPNMKKNIAKLYVQKFFGRDPDFINNINFTTPAMFKKYLVSPETRGKLYLHSVGPFSPVFEIHKYCADNSLLPDPARYSGIKKIMILLLRRKLIALAMRLPFYAMAKFLEFIGLAISFDMILYKNK
jgi:SAM-dependent methyltransferase